MTNVDPAHPAYDGLRSIARKTGLRLETVAALGMADQLSRLFDDGRLRDGAELRSLERAGSLRPGAQPNRTTHQRMLDLLAIRWAQKPLTPRQRLLELYRLKGEWTDNGR